jgi:hypothetical protein
MQITQFEHRLLTTIEMVEVGKKTKHTHAHTHT